MPGLRGRTDRGRHGRVGSTSTRRRVLGTRFAERNPAVLGLVGAVAIAVITVGSLSAASITSALTEDGHRARFTEAGGLREGDDVRIAGLSVGRVTAIAIEDGEVEVSFTVDDEVALGGDTTAAIKSATVLGRKFLQVTPVGSGSLGDAVIPLERTRAPFDVQSRLEDLGGELGDLDQQQLADAIGTVNDTLEETPEEVRLALDGVRRAASVITRRDGALLTLLSSASQVSGLLADRSTEVTTLVRDANSLLAELTNRREALRAVLVNAEALVGQVRGLAQDNQREIGPALAELDRVTTLVREHEADVTAVVEGLRNYTGSLGEAVNAGPWFYGYIANLAPPNMAQQTVDSILSQIPDGDPRTNPSPLAGLLGSSSSDRSAR